MIVNQQVAQMRRWKVFVGKKGNRTFGSLRRGDTRPPGRTRASVGFFFFIRRIKYKEIVRFGYFLKTRFEWNAKFRDGIFASSNMRFAASGVR